MKDHQRQSRIPTQSTAFQPLTLPKSQQQFNGSPLVSPQRFCPQSHYKAKHSHLSNSRISTLAEQNHLLNQALQLRDREIDQLRQFLTRYKNQNNKNQAKMGTEVFAYRNHNKQNLGKTIVALNQQLDETRIKYDRSCQRIRQLQIKIRQILSKNQLQQQQLKQQIETLKEDKKYQRDQYQRIVDNMKIQFQQKLAARLKLQQDKGNKEKALVQERVSHLQQDIHQKTLDIARLTDKLRLQKEQNEGHCKFVQNQNKQLKRQLQVLQFELTNDFKSKENKMLQQFNADIDQLHEQQKKEIQILCQRINFLKAQLAERDQQIREEYWKSRDLHLKAISQEGCYDNGSKGSTIHKSLIGSKLKTQGPSCYLKQKNDYRSIQTSASIQIPKRQSALKAYMK